MPIKENDSDLNDNSKKGERKRGRSHYPKDIQKLISDKEQRIARYQRNSRKSATLIHNSFFLPEKLHSVEMKIPVINETFVTQKFGNPDKYYDGGKLSGIIL